MGLNKLVGRRRAGSAPADGRYRVVVHRPVLRAVMLVLVALVVAAAAGLGYWLGSSKSDLDATHIASLEIRQRAQQARLEALDRELADARLAQSIDAEAARLLRETIRELRGRVAGLREEVTFYKSLMAPSSMERGLQIAEFDLVPGDQSSQFTYHILLTQKAEQRSWISGDVRVEVSGVRVAADGSAPDGASAEEVLSLTDLEDVEDYPLRFRFRYFQNFSGIVTLPDGFQPRSIRVTATPRGGSSDAAEREFDWTPRAG